MLADLDVFLRAEATEILWSLMTKIHDKIKAKAAETVAHTSENDI